MANTRVKVPRTVLIERIQEAIDKATKEHADKVAEYEKKKDELMSKLPGELEKLAKEIMSFTDDQADEFFSKLRKNNYAGDKLMVLVNLRLPLLDDDGYYYRRTERGYTYASHDFEGYIKQLEKSKRVLEASTEELISVAANDAYADYL